MHVGTVHQSDRAVRLLFGDPIEGQESDLAVLEAVGDEDAAHRDAHLGGEVDVDARLDGQVAARVHKDVVPEEDSPVKFVAFG